MHAHPSLPALEPLEQRFCLSAAPTGLSPAQVRHAYGFDRIVFSRNGKALRSNGSGQTIAIVDAYDDPNIANDLRVFDRTFHLSDTDWRGKFALTKVMQKGTRPNKDWALEISLDVEWAHAIAPKAHILLVEARSPTVPDLLRAIDYARSQKGVVAVSMSWGGDESPFETFYDNHLTTPPGHIGGYGIKGGVTFVTSSGDTGAPASWPAVSPNVLAVGGTTLTLGPGNTWQNEVAWAGSGGGLSVFEPVTTAAPDVAYNADPATGYSVYCSYQAGAGGPWSTVGGTSAGAPQWASLIALVDQGRALKGLGSLDIQQTLRAIYNVPSSDFHDIVQGSNGFLAGPGFDLVTGRGSPIANRLVPGIIHFTQTRNVKTRALSKTSTPSLLGNPVLS